MLNPLICLLSFNNVLIACTQACLGTVFSLPLSMVKVARGSLFSFLGYFSLVVKLFQQEGLCSSKSPATVYCNLGWSLNSALCLCLLIFSVSSSCEPNKDPFAMTACTSPAVLQSCKSLSLLTGIQFLLAAVMAWISGVLILGAWSPKRAWEVSSLQRGLF